MTRNSTARTLLFATFGIVLVAASSAAHADGPTFICYHDGGADDNSQGFSVICSDSDWAYAVATVTPSGDDGGDIDLHVTDHGACSGGSHMECTFSDGDHDICLTEGDYPTTYKGVVSAVSWTCMCYTEDSPCQNSGI